MTRSDLAFLLLLASTACIVDRNLGDTEGSTGTEGSTQATLPGTDGLSMTATMASTSTTAADTSVSMTATMSDDGSSSSTSPTETETGGPLCPSWEPPNLDCAAPGQAEVDVQGDEIPQVEDLPCQIAAIESVNANTDSIQLDCGEIYEFTITTNPYHPLLLNEGQNVILDAAYDEQDAMPPPPPRSFSLRTNLGGLQLAWVNERDDAQDLEVELDLAPAMFELIESGCPGISVDAFCDAGGEMLSQRRAVEFGGGVDPVVVFDGNAGGVPVGTSPMMLYVEQAQQIACWDADCAGTEAGPFEELRMLFLPVFS